jgi:hypothetical protein
MVFLLRCLSILRLGAGVCHNLNRAVPRRRKKKGGRNAAKQFRPLWNSLTRKL